MRVIYLTFLSFAFTALCAPSAASATQSLTRDGDGIAIVLEKIAGDVVELFDDVVDDVFTDDAEPTPLFAVSTPPEPTTTAIPAPPQSVQSRALTDSSPTSASTPSISELYSHVLRTTGRTLDLAHGVMDILVPVKGQAPSGTQVARRADGAEHTPSIRELFSRSLSICGRALDGVDRVLDGAHGAVTSTTPLAARDLSSMFSSMVAMFTQTLQEVHATFTKIIAENPATEQAF